jgi:hypothetical protein
MFSSPERLVAKMVARRAEIRIITRRIQGCHEWGVRVARRVPAASPAPARSAPSGVAFLAAKKRARDSAREATTQALDAAEQAYGLLEPLARDALRRNDVPPGVAAPPLLEAAFLVPLARKARFRLAVRRAAAICKSAGADLRLTGPWPAYSFARVPEDTA